MKKILLAIPCFFMYGLCHAQQAAHKIPAKAKILNDSAVHKFQQAAGDPDKLQKIFPILDAAIKTDSLYYEAWNEKLTLQGMFDQFENEYRSLRVMERLFPAKEEVQFNTGILAYKTSRTKEAQAIFAKLVTHYTQLLEKNRNNGNTRGLLFNKGVALILADKEAEGKRILNDLYKTEKDGMTQSAIAFYINSSRQEIINDRIPGK